MNDLNIGDNVRVHNYFYTKTIINTLDSECGVMYMVGFEMSSCIFFGYWLARVLETVVR